MKVTGFNHPSIGARKFLLAGYQDRMTGEIARNQMAGIGRKPNASLYSGPGLETGAYAAMIARAEALIPQLSARASRTEELRRLPPETERDLHEAACSGSCSRSASAAPNSTMSRWSIAPSARRRPTRRWPGISPIWRAITGCSACSTSARRTGLERGPRCADRVLLHLSGRPRQESRGRIYAARQLAVLVGRRFQRMEHARQRRFVRRRGRRHRIPDLPAAARATTRSSTPGTRRDCAEPDRTTSKSGTPSWPSHDAGGGRSRRRPDAGQRRQSERAVCAAGVLAVSLRAVRRRRSAMRRHASTIMSRSRGTAPRPTTAPSSATSRAPRSRSPRLPPRSTRRA